MNMAPSSDYSNSVFGIREHFCVHDNNDMMMRIPDSCTCGNERSGGWSPGLTHSSPRIAPRWRHSADGLSMKQLRYNSCILLVCLPLLLFSFMDVTHCSGLPPVFWNTSNVIFNQSNEHSHVIDVHLGDTLDIFCPHYSNKTTVPEKDWEYYIIYMVDKENYNKCIIQRPHQKVLIINCSRPEDINKFTLLIFEYQPIPHIPDFELGKDYYITSTSRGSKFGMRNQYKGACDDKHMKIMLRVRPPGNGNYNNNNNNNNNHNNNNNNNNVHPETGTTMPVDPSETTRRTTLDEQTTPTTPTTTTYHPKHITDKPIGDGDGSDNNNNGGDKELPGTDGFPDDNTVIDASDGPEINTGVIDDKEDMKDNSASTGVIPSYVNIFSITSLVILLTQWVMRVAVRGR